MMIALDLIAMLCWGYLAYGYYTGKLTPTKGQSAAYCVCLVIMTLANMLWRIG